MPEPTEPTNGETKKPATTKNTKRLQPPKPRCGIIMPISGIDNCNEQHWSDVREILEDAIGRAGFDARLVSDADEVGIIQKRIIQNIYDDPVVVCDVSGKNPNVMFELGLRLAFDKPAIIVKDDKTAYSFDTSPIEHLEYPRDLRFAKIVEFQTNLAEKIKATLTRAQSDKDYTTFLKHFGSFSVAKLPTREVAKDAFIMEELQGLKSLLLRQLARSNDRIDAERRNALEREMEGKFALRAQLSRMLQNPELRKAMHEKNGIKSLREKVEHELPAPRYFSHRGHFEQAFRDELHAVGIQAES